MRMPIGHYVFVCYSHEDEDAVLEEIHWLEDQGATVWYDMRIGPGSEWSDELAVAIKGASHFLYFITPRSVATENCRRELNFALAENRHVLAVHLEQTDVPDGIRLNLDNRQAIHRYRITTDAYRQSLRYTVLAEAEPIQPVHGGRETKGTDDRSALTIAVLPFANLTGDPDQEYFSEGITTDIIADLSKFGLFFVISRNSSFSYKGTAVNAVTAG